MTDDAVPPKFTRRTYLTLSALESGGSPMWAREAVASVALAHPDWDMDERREWVEWMSDVEAPLWLGHDG